jgi:hypothetical protein
MGDHTSKPLDLGRALNDAVDTYKRNFLVFLLAAVLFDLLSMFSLMILAGPLWGGIVLMSLRCMSDPKGEARLGDIFGAFHRFGPLVALFFIQLIPMLFGYALLIVPGIMLTALWMFPTFLMLEHNLGVFDSLGTSARIVIRRGFWINVAAAFLIAAIGLGPMLIPYVGWLVSFFVAPLAWLINTSVYIQEVREQQDVGDFGARGFPVQPPPFAQPAPQG